MSVRIPGTAVRSETLRYSLSYSVNSESVVISVNSESVVISVNSESVVILSETLFVSRRIWARRAINFAFVAKLQNRAFGALPY
jgi:hypothetical protein